MKIWVLIAVPLLLSANGLAQDSSVNSRCAPKCDNSAESGTFMISGHVNSVGGTPVSGARVSVGEAAAITDSYGNFRLSIRGGASWISISAVGFDRFSVTLPRTTDAELNLELQPAAAITVSARDDKAATAATVQAYSTEELTGLATGRPGVPVILPGYPSETASGGVKAPQYFAPGVAGDHGEPIAQYIRVGDFLFPNNLPANAHGNGYADPNLLVPAAIGDVESDPGAFDVRHGNHAVDLAVAYGLRPRLGRFFQVSGDRGNYDLVSGFSSRNPQTSAWLGFELAGGNGFLDFPEHRHQYKVNGQRLYLFRNNLLTLFGVGYIGQSRIPGLVPIDVRVPGDTINPHQSDHTHTAVLVASDTWQLTDRKQLQFSDFFRTYSLDLKSDFGDGLIRQSEFRRVMGGNSSYNQKMNSRVSFSAGVDFRRDSPHDDQLAHRDLNGTFQPVTRNDFIINDVAPYASFYGSLVRFFSYSIGVRRDGILFSNTDRLRPANSYEASSGLTAPRGTVSFSLPNHRYIPTLAFSSGEAFHTNDPRIVSGTVQATPIASSRAQQLVATESVLGTEFRVAVSRVSNAAEFAKVDPDTGLQEDLGPSLVRSLTVSARRHFALALFQATFARANATETLSRQDVPEAPRLVWDFSATSVRLPWRMQASGGFEYVGAKPLGDGFTAVPVREIRGAFSRSFANGLEAALYFLAASGYTGQTLETFRFPSESSAIERIVGVRNPSHAGVSFTYHFDSR